MSTNWLIGAGDIVLINSLDKVSVSLGGKGLLKVLLTTVSSAKVRKREKHVFNFLVHACHCKPVNTL